MTVPVLRRWHRLAAGLACCLLAADLAAGATAGWREPLRAQIERIDRESPGTLGVYVKDLASGETLSHGASEFWYLGSTTKVLVAIAVLQAVDAGRLRLADRLVIADADRIEASQVVWQPLGTRYPIDELLRRMLFDSDNTAANMLIRSVGIERVNETARAALGTSGFRELTDFARVRQDVYAEIHPDAGRLRGDPLVRIAAAPLGPARVEAVRRALGKPAAELSAKTIDEAYARYYRTLRNSATLEAYAAMLEKLVEGELLSPASTARLFTLMKLGNFTNYRLQAGLPRSVPFIHKTGTQYLRACHAGVIRPADGGRRGIVVAACTADLDEQHAAGQVLERVGRALAETMLANER